MGRTYDIVESEWVNDPRIPVGIEKCLSEEGGWQHTIFYNGSHETYTGFKTEKEAEKDHIKHLIDIWMERLELICDAAGVDFAEIKRQKGFQMSYKILGMNGEPVVQCGQTFVVVERLKDNMVSIFQPNSSPGDWFAKDEVTGRWTEFETPVDMSEEWASERVLALYIDNTEFKIPDALLKENWVRTKQYKDILAFCGPEEHINAVANEWGAFFKEHFDLTSLYITEGDKDRLKALADNGLCFARDPELRWELSVRYCSMQGEEKAKATFEHFVEPIADKTWDHFADEMKPIIARIRK